MAQKDATPLQTPIAIGSAVWYTWVIWRVEGLIDEEQGMSKSRYSDGVGILTGEGRWSLKAASFSPGASKATTGTPKVAPVNDANAPPREWPKLHRLAQ